jgi:hypothetical protein
MTHHKPPRAKAFAMGFALIAGAFAVIVSSAPASAATIITINGHVVYTDTTTVEDGTVLRFDPTQDTTVEISGNLIVAGTLEMKPNPGITHTLRFMDVNEATFVGGGTEVLESDQGLWVVGSGQLDLLGEKKAGWNRTGADPTWTASDELLVAPTAVGDYGEDGFKSFVLGSVVPQVDDTLPPAEVINLTRSVNIEGTPAGRSHVTIMSSAPQSIRYASFRFLGPRQDDGKGATIGVVGRYPLHFHHAGDGSRGSIIEGSVIRESGNRAVVPHGSHGITVNDTVAYDIFGTAFWWDKGDDSQSHDSVWDHNFVGHVQVDPPYRGFLLSGFSFGLGDGNVASNNAVAGILGNKDCSGFLWPGLDSGLASGIWDFHDNVAHNNKCHGIHVWQNNPFRHHIEKVTAYRNGISGVNHGAYTNEYTYSYLYLYENGEAGIQDHAWSGLPSPDRIGQTWSCITIAKSPVGVRIMESSAPTDGGAASFAYITLTGTPVLAEVDDNALDAGQTLEERAVFSHVGETCPAGFDPFPDSGRFTDDDGNIHETNIEIIAAAGITLGCNPPTNNLYCPSRDVTRGEMAAFLVRAFSLPASDIDRFSDDDDSVFEPSIQALAEAGITLGCNPPENTRYCPSAAVSRAQMATLLVRALNLPPGGPKDFIDDDNSVHEPAIEALAAAGITLGCNPPDNTKYCPSSPVRRDQMASFLARAIVLK